ncbi:unnamed protein product [Brassica rapa subsp. narinosa]
MKNLFLFSYIITGLHFRLIFSSVFLFVFFSFVFFFSLKLYFSFDLLKNLSKRFIFCFF